MDARALRPGPIRSGAIAILAIAALAGACGLTQAVVFHQPTLLKYAVTVGGPLLLLYAVSMRQPARCLVPALIIGAPFGAFVMTFKGVQISALAALLLLAAVAVIVSDEPAGRLSRTGAAALLAVPLVAVPVVTGSAGTSIATVIGAMIATGWVVSRTARTESGLRVVLWAFLLAATIQGGLAIWEFRSGHLLNLYGSAGSQVFGTDYFFGYGSKNRPIGSLFDPISLGNVLALACPLAIVLVATARSLAAKLVAAAGGIVVAVGLTLSFSRASWIGAAAGCLVAIMLMPPATRRVAVIPSLAAVAAVAALAIGGSGGALSSRFSSILNPTGPGVRTAQGDRERVNAWNVALATAAGAPVFGVGFGDLLPRLESGVPGSAAASNAQSTYLQVLAEAGGVGAFALILLLLALGRDVTASLRHRRMLAAGLAGAFTCMLICWFTDYTIRYTSVAVMFAVIMGAMASGGRRFPLNGVRPGTTLVSVASTDGDPLDGRATRRNPLDVGFLAVKPTEDHGDVA
jgi:O-antigen ligase